MTAVMLMSSGTATWSQNLAYRCSCRQDGSRLSVPHHCCGEDERRALAIGRYCVLRTKEKATMNGVGIIWM